MRRGATLFFIFASCLLLPLSSFAQSTLVNGTVTDPNGVPYANAAMKIVLVDTASGIPVGSPTVTVASQAQCTAARAGTAPCQIPIQGTFQLALDSSGNIPGGGIVLSDNSLVTPSGTQWQFTVTTPGIPPPQGFGPQTFTSTITITGATQNISAVLQAAALAQGAILGRGGVSLISTPFSATPNFAYTQGSQETSFSMQLTGNVTSSTVSGPFSTGSDIQLILCQDATGGRTFSWPSVFLNVPTLASAGNGCTAGTWVFCGSVGNAACPANQWQNTDQGPVTVGGPGANGIFATNYGLHYDGQIAWGATCTNGNSTITTSATDPPFTGSDQGKVIYGTDVPPAGGPSGLSRTLIVGSLVTDVTISTVTDSHHVVISTAPSANCPNLTNVVWGTPDATTSGTGPLANAWAAAIAACTNLIVPGINSEGTQAAYMLVEGDWSSAMPTNAVGCINPTGSVRSGPGVVGQLGQGNSVFANTPTFATSTCTGHNPASNNSCYFWDQGGGFAGGLTLRNFLIWGDGLTLGGTAKTVLTIGAQGILDHVACVETSFNNGVGVMAAGQDIVINTPEFDGCGGIGLEAIANTSSSRYVQISGGGYIGDETTPIKVTSGTNTVVSTGDLYGPGSGATAAVEVDSGAEFISNADQCIGGGNSCFQLNGGTLRLSQLSIPPPLNGTGAAVWGATGTSNVYVNNSDLINVGESFFVSAAATLNYFDGGLNKYAATALSNSGTFNQFGSLSTTGTACATGNWALTSGWGTSSITSVTAGGDSHRCQVVITGAAGAASPVLTWTFPTAYVVAPGSCQISFNGTLTGESTGAPSATSVAFTFTGTPSAQTYRLDASCGP